MPWFVEGPTRRCVKCGDCFGPTFFANKTRLKLWRGAAHEATCPGQGKCNLTLEMSCRTGRGRKNIEYHNIMAHTPLKINMELKNHQIEKETHLTSLHFNFSVPCKFSLVQQYSTLKHSRLKVETRLTDTILFKSLLGQRNKPGVLDYWKQRQLKINFSIDQVTWTNCCNLFDLLEMIEQVKHLFIWYVFLQCRCTIEKQIQENPVSKSSFP